MSKKQKIQPKKEHISKTISKRVRELKSLNLLDPKSVGRSQKVSTPPVLKKISRPSTPVLQQPTPIDEVQIAAPKVDEIPIQPLKVEEVITPTQKIDEIIAQFPPPKVDQKSFMDKTKTFLTNKHTFFTGKSFQITLLNWHLILIFVLTLNSDLG